MPPIDPSPHGKEIMHKPPQKRFAQPQPEVDGKPAKAPEGPGPEEAGTDMHNRPQIPAHPHITAADVEDEEADPVVDTGPGIADGPNTRPSGRG